MLKLSPAHLPAKKMFPSINAHSRAVQDDSDGVEQNDGHDRRVPSKQHKYRRQQQQQQQTNERQRRRSPLRIIYRSSDYIWNDSVPPSSQRMLADTPLRSKLTTSVGQLTNAMLHDTTIGTTSTSMLHLPTSSPTLDPTPSVDYFHSSTSKSHHTPRLQRTNSYLDKLPNSTPTLNHGSPARSDSHRSSQQLDFGLRAQYRASKPRPHGHAKISTHDLSAGNFYLSSAHDDHISYQHEKPTLSYSNQQLNVSAFDLTANRKSLAAYRSNPNYISAHHAYDTRQPTTRPPARGTLPKEQQSKTTLRHRPASNQGVRKGSHEDAALQALVMLPSDERQSSGRSTKSRDPNVSYAYNDVRKYIEENELMSPEKEQHIRNWILDVEKYRHQLQKIE